MAGTHSVPEGLDHFCGGEFLLVSDYQASRPSNFLARLCARCERGSCMRAASCRESPAKRPMSQQHSRSNDLPVFAPKGFLADA